MPNNECVLPSEFVPGLMGGPSIYHQYLWIQHVGFQDIKPEEFEQEGVLSKDIANVIMKAL